MYSPASNGRICPLESMHQSLQQSACQEQKQKVHCDNSFYLIKAKQLKLKLKHVRILLGIRTWHAYIGNRITLFESLISLKGSNILNPGKIWSVFLLLFTEKQIANLFTSASITVTQDLCTSAPRIKDCPVISFLIWMPKANSLRSFHFKLYRINGNGERFSCYVISFNNHHRSLKDQRWFTVKYKIFFLCA